MNDTILSLRGVTKKYPAFTLSEVSLTLPRGYIMGFVGQNGAGKTTTVRCLLGNTRPDSGSIEVFGLDSAKHSAGIRSRIGAVYDSCFFAGHLRRGDVAAILRGFYPKWDDALFRQHCERFELPAKTKVKDYSKGMQMKLMLAAALSHRAELLILDEPTSGLDPVARDLLLDTLSEYIADGEGSVLFSTHITGDIERIADYVTVLNSGRVWFTGTKDDLMEKFVIVRGAEHDLPERLRSQCIGLHLRSGSFEALLDAGHAVSLPDTIIYEKPTIDEMIVAIAREEEHHA